MIPVLTLLLSLPWWSPDVRADTGAPRLTIGTLARAEVAGGCGCSFFVPGDRRTDAPLVLRIEADGNATMRLDGETVKLRKTGEKLVQRGKKHPTAGDKLLLTLRGPQAQASVNAALLNSCRVRDGCRQLSYRSVIAVSRNGARQSVSADGVCGC